MSKRLALGFGVLVVLMMASAAFAWTALRSSDAALKTMYEDRVIALVLLDDVHSLPVRNRVILMDAAMREDADVTAKHLDEFEKNRIEAAKAWKDYMATYLTPEEADLAKKAVAAAQPYDDEALAPRAAALRSGDYQEARRLAATKVSKLAPAMVEATHDLIKLQLRVAKQIYSESTVANERSLLAIVALGLFANGAAVIATFLITRKIVGQLGAEPHELAEVAGRVAGGDLTSSNRGRGGLTEGSVMAAMETMR
ncbi:MAG: Tar ligand binding domain-containing protein, partial [Inhella sp.]